MVSEKCRLAMTNGHLPPDSQKTQQILQVPANSNHHLQVPTKSRPPSTSTASIPNFPSDVESTKSTEQPVHSAAELPLGLKEITENCRKDYLQAIFKVVKR